MASKMIVGVMGPGEKAQKIDCDRAYRLGQYIAREDWVLLTGGRDIGVMKAASLGAKSAEGLVIGILPGCDRRGVSEAVDITIVTDLGNARNNINILSCDAIIACGMGLGTASEISLALKSGKSVILLNDCRESHAFFSKLVGDRCYFVQTPEEAIARVKQLFGIT